MPNYQKRNVSDKSRLACLTTKYSKETDSGAILHADTIPGPFRKGNEISLLLSCIWAKPPLRVE